MTESDGFPVGFMLQTMQETVNEGVVSNENIQDSQSQTSISQ